MNGYEHRECYECGTEIGFNEECTEYNLFGKKLWICFDCSYDNEAFQSLWDGEGLRKFFKVIN